MALIRDAKDILNILNGTCFPGSIGCCQADMYLDKKIKTATFTSMESGARIRLILSRAAKAMDAADRMLISQSGLNISDFGILEALFHKGPMPINTIGEKVLLTSGSMTTAANRLEKKGLITRIKDPSDGRCFYLHLTKPGRQLIKRVFEEHSQNLEEMAKVLTAAERSHLVKLLKKIGQHAQDIARAKK